MSLRALGVVVFALALACACDSDGGTDAGGGGTDAGGGGGGPMAMCTAACQTLDREVCFAQTEAECIAECVGGYGMGCDAEADDYVTCVAGSTAGNLCPGMMLLMGECGTETQALGDCLATP